VLKDVTTAHTPLAVRGLAWALRPLLHPRTLPIALYAFHTGERPVQTCTGRSSLSVDSGAF
jgi:hypothetical protein